MQGLTFIEPLAWPQVWDFWRHNEDQPDSHWIEVWRSKGFLSWADWRRHTHANLLEAMRTKPMSWGLYLIDNPLEMVPTFLGGPFRAWKEQHYGDEDTLTFAELAQMRKVQQQPFILDLAENFPLRTTITAIQDSEGIKVVEGMHRSCALALRAFANDPLPADTQVQLILAPWPDTLLPALGNTKDQHR